MTNLAQANKAAEISNLHIVRHACGSSLYFIETLDGTLINSAMSLEWAVADLARMVQDRAKCN